MPTYYLQEGFTPNQGPARTPEAGGIKEKRIFLHDELVKGNTLIQEVVAPSWIHARASLPDFI